MTIQELQHGLFGGTTTLLGAVVGEHIIGAGCVTQLGRRGLSKWIDEYIWEGDDITRICAGCDEPIIRCEGKKNLRS